MQRRKREQGFAKEKKKKKKKKKRKKWGSVFSRITIYPYTSSIFLRSKRIWISFYIFVEAE